MQIIFSNNTNIEYSANIIIQSEFQLMNEPERPDPKSLWKCVCLIATEMSTYQNELCEKKYKFLYLHRSQYWSWSQTFDLHNRCSATEYHAIPFRIPMPHTIQTIRDDLTHERFFSLIRNFRTTNKKGVWKTVRQQSSSILIS